MKKALNPPPPNKPAWLVADFRLGLGLKWSLESLFQSQQCQITSFRVCLLVAVLGEWNYKWCDGSRLTLQGPGGIHCHAPVDGVWHRVSPWELAKNLIPTPKTLHLNRVPSLCSCSEPCTRWKNLPTSLGFSFLMGKIGRLTSTSPSCCEDWIYSVTFMLCKPLWLKASFKHELAIWRACM